VNGPELLTEEQRRARADRTGGEPILDFRGQRSPYAAYADMDILLTLQNPRSGSPDELVFMISGQVMELLFKLMVHELTQAQRHIDDDQTIPAITTLRRVTRVQELLVKAWDPVTTLTPGQYVGFRDFLGEASGFQSAGYRQLEFLLGNKMPSMLRPHEGAQALHATLSQALQAPSIYDSVQRLLSRRGFQVDGAHLDRDLTQPYQSHSSVERAWLAVYSQPDEADELFRLGEALIDIADLYRQWRYRHLVSVERLMGHKPGTGGTGGASWLRQIIDHQFFSELWAARTLL
jgi:tryptophan 2,3-dioxygenase